MQNPAISVIIPAYNAAATIRETIQSVLQQTFQDFEVIIINDGSTDDTLKIVQQITDSRLQVLSFENSGPQHSRNRGLKVSRGEYIALLDADDLWAPQKLEQQFTALQKSPMTAIAFSWTDTIDENSQVIRACKRPQNSGYIFTTLILDNFLGSGSNPLIPAKAIRSVGGFDEAILAGQDWDMWLSLAANYEFLLVPEVHIFYRKTSITRSWSSHLQRQEKGLMQVMNKHLNQPAAADVSKARCLANCYRYLLFECFEKCSPSFAHGLLALRFFCRAVILEPGWWVQRYRMLLVVLAKSMKYLVTIRNQPNTAPTSSFTQQSNVHS